MKQTYDVILAGGGMVGLTLAALMDDGCRVAVVDPEPTRGLSELTGHFDSRVSAISRASQTILQQVGAWSKIPESRRAPYQTMVVWDANGSQALKFDAQSLAQPDLGHILENQVVRAALVECLQSRSHIDWFPSTLVQCERDPRQVKCQLDSGEWLQAALLVGADGAHSRVRAAFDFDVEQKDYGQTALVANIQTQHSHQWTAWQRFLPTGPIAYLPLPEHQMCSIVWSAEDKLARTLLSLSPSQQARRIAVALDYRLGEVALQTELKAFPLVARHSLNYLQPRVALIGDAAHTLHPLAGQGVNMGLLDAFELAVQLKRIRTAGKDLGDVRRLRPFERRRKGHNHIVQKSMTALNWIYGQQSPGWVLARNWGVQQLNRISPLKSRLIKQAMGLSYPSSI